ncbi:MAG: hypothetical protein SPH66_08340 [Gemmiger sp.]|uniref:hypothetical protein n=1 Tax=Gemmiger sp. TaxID=2049027 RepID=UPI002A824960|nr:hypothetical protein [Gemmiger sp.]MDD6609338.1 hypothetical protein [Subdoligranulum variabile]MDD6649688.1 hypothetical protein [Subdoligranulum variabile]MDY4447654.1 hypothetical protein [Gemmiger sp.]MDY5203954.1 hypothetical protein [Gemmiger sp.]MDY5411968.1 hypothetical protein [Gemmiger sp.]
MPISFFMCVVPPCYVCIKRQKCVASSKLLPGSDAFCFLARPIVATLQTLCNDFYIFAKTSAKEVNVLLSRAPQWAGRTNKNSKSHTFPVQKV